MTERKALRWSSPENAWAVGAMLIMLLIPVLSVTEVYQPVALEAISRPLADAWQWMLLASAIIGLLSTLAMQFALGNGSRMIATAHVEAIATLVVAACLLLLWWALVQEYGFAANPLTQLLVGGLGVVALFRVGQIIWQLWRYRRALRIGNVAHTEAIAQPKET